MKKDTFYSCMRDYGHIITAVKTDGYSEGDIGVYEENGTWKAVHIPTGIRLRQNPSGDTTKEAALERAQKFVAERPNFDGKIKRHLCSAVHAAFLWSKQRGGCDAPQRPGT